MLSVSFFTKLLISKTKSIGEYFSVTWFYDYEQKYSFNSERKSICLSSRSCSHISLLTKKGNTEDIGRIRRVITQATMPLWRRRWQITEKLTFLKSWLINDLSCGCILYGCLLLFLRIDINLEYIIIFDGFSWDLRHSANKIK